MHVLNIHVIKLTYILELKNIILNLKCNIYMHKKNLSYMLSFMYTKYIYMYLNN